MKLLNKNKPKCDSTSGKADRRMSQNFPTVTFTNVLPMNPSILRSHPGLCSVSAKYQFMSIPIVTNYVYSARQHQKEKKNLVGTIANEKNRMKIKSCHFN